MCSKGRNWIAWWKENDCRNPRPKQQQILVVFTATCTANLRVPYTETAYVKVSNAWRVCDTYHGVHFFKGGGGGEQPFKRLCFPTPQIGTGLSTDLNRCNHYGTPYQQRLSIGVVKELELRQRYKCVKKIYEPALCVWWICIREK